MPAVARRVTIATTATSIYTGAAQVAAGGSNAPAVLLKNTHASATVYLGPTAVTTATGYPLAAGETLAIGELGAGDDLYGIVASGTAVVAVLEVK